MKNIHPARLMAAAEALVALVAAFLPLSGEQVATILGVVAVLTGERVVRKSAPPNPEPPVVTEYRALSPPGAHRFGALGNE